MLIQIFFNVGSNALRIYILFSLCTYCIVSSLVTVLHTSVGQGSNPGSYHLPMFHVYRFLDVVISICFHSVLLLFAQQAFYLLFECILPSLATSDTGTLDKAEDLIVS